MLVIDQPGKVGEQVRGYSSCTPACRILSSPRLLQLLGPRVLVHEQRKLGGKADVGKR